MFRRKRRQPSLLELSQTQQRLKKELYARMKTVKRKKVRKPFFLVRLIKSIFRLFPRFVMKPRTTRELSSVFMFFLAVMMILSYTDNMGIFGTWLSHTLTLIFGWGAYGIPVLLTAMGIRLMLFTDAESEEDIRSFKVKKENIGYVTRLYLGGFLLTSFILGIVHLGASFDDIKTVADAGQYGGYFGFTMNFFLRGTFGDIGTLMIGFFGAVASFLFGFDISLVDIWKKFKKMFEPSAVIVKKASVNKGIIQIRKIETPSMKKIEKKKIEKKEADQLTIQDFTLTEGEEWEFPNLNLLDFSPFNVERNESEIEYYQNIIQKTLADFNISVEMHEVSVGPAVMQFALKPEAGTKLSKIVALQNDLALALAAESVRIEAPIPGKSLVGIEIPNQERHSVRLRDILESKEFNSIKSNLRLPLGRDIEGKPVVADLATMPHLLVAGATGSGKSVAINTFLTTLLYQNSPADLRLILIDPKRVELAPYNAIPHLLTPVITDATKTVAALRWAVAEMDRRYKLFADNGHRNITEFNKTESKKDKIPFIVIIIDELADLMMISSKEVETLICRIAQMARAVGIHLIVATQRPSVDVITGLIKANIPARIAFTVASGIDSRTIIDSTGADKLLGQGDMLYLPGNESRLYRVQGVLLEKGEVQNVLRHIKLTREPDYKSEVIAPHTKIEVQQFKIPGLDDFSENSEDEMLEKSLQVIRETQKASASLLQRRLRLGYSRAARMIDLLEEKGYIGPSQGSKPREVFVEQERRMY